VFHSPEFLTEAKASFDAANPTRNIVGYPVDNEEYKKRAQEILDILPDSPLNFICKAKEAELVKYASNCFLFMKVIYANIFYDLAEKEGSDWQKVRAGLAADPRIGESHLNPVHASGTDVKVGRGAGGHCFIKDFAALRLYAEELGIDQASLDFLKATEGKNIHLLKNSEKDIELLLDVYGEI
jgi:UDPglucose 6-dehydrogenase